MANIPHDDSDFTAARRAMCLRRVVACFGLLLFGLTWRLWTSQDVFPQAPLLRALVDAPLWCDWIGLGVALAALLAMLIAPADSRLGRSACLALVAAIAAMVLVDQHRLQPWAYQFALLAVVLGTCPPRWSLRLARALTIGIYFYSAISKLDHTFLYTLGQQLLSAALGLVGASSENWPLGARTAGAAAFPICELTIAALLTIRATRKVGLVAAIAMHAVLLLVLGPWGLDHRAGVLAWNAYFIVQDWVLFSRRPRDLATEATAAVNQSIQAPGQMKLRYLGVLALVAALVLPALEPLRRFDHWPAWAVYAPQGAYITFLVANDAAEALPVEVRQFLNARRDDTTWRALRIDRWSLAALGVPVYPQERFQLAVALDVIDRYQLAGAAHVVLHGPADRISGLRDKTVLADRQAIEQAASEYKFGAFPRSARLADRKLPAP